MGNFLLARPENKQRHNWMWNFTVGPIIKGDQVGYSSGVEP